jgi:hypothetical protein
VLNQTVQPQIVIIGNLLQIQKVFVSVDNVFYRAESVLKAIDMVFKTYIALDMKYPFACQQVWVYIQQYLYDIHLSTDINLPSVVAFAGLIMK